MLLFLFCHVKVNIAYKQRGCIQDNRECLWVFREAAEKRSIQYERKIKKMVAGDIY